MTARAVRKSRQPARKAWRPDDRAALVERTFLRHFVKATGIRQTEYHQRLRITRSQQMLEHSNDRVDKIATAVGYADPSGFHGMFKQIVGLSPL